MIPKKNILIIEDNLILADYFSYITETYGNVDTAHTIAVALKKLTDNTYDVIIFDVRLPAMNGIAFFKKARGLDPAIKKKFLFFIHTAFKKQIKFMHSNHIRFIRKTLQSEDIKCALEEMLYQSRSCCKSLSHIA
ncbi:MAG: response regulator [Nitrospiraceae bacterium]|nr:MAG: response regulator [Nitrospiraceae bacterium]